MTLELHGSPRTAARQLIELLTRDNILNEDGSLNQDTVQRACRYAGGEQCIGQRTLDEWAAPPGQLYVDGNKDFHEKMQALSVVQDNKGSSESHAPDDKKHKEGSGANNKYS